MPLIPKSILKTFFEAGDVPTEQQFGALIDSTVNLIDDRGMMGLRTHSNSVSYVVGDTVIYNGLIYQASVPSQGAFVSGNWNKLTFGAVNYVGTWDAATNSPTITSSSGNKGDYYVVNVPGNTTIDLISDWEVRDWIVFNGFKWEKVDNSDLDVQTAEMVSFDPVPSGMNANNVQDAIDELQLRIDTVETDAGNLQTNKVDKVISASADDLAVFVTGGNIADSGRKLSQYIGFDNTTAFTPTIATHPATKGYVDSSIGAITHTAETTSFTPAGNITTTDVQAAIEELDSIKEPANANIQLHIASSSNPHNVTKAQVGLGNVPNVDATDRANHTGTQLAATISDFASTALNTVLTGLSLVSGAAITAADSILSAIGKLQKQISDNLSTLTSHMANTSNPHSVTKTQVGLSEVENLKVNLTATTNPGATNDSSQGYAVGSRWTNVTSQHEFVCLSATAGTAVWKLTTPIFGNDYQFVTSAARTTTGSTTFQVKTTLTTPALTGTYRLQWKAVVDNNNNDPGEYRLADITANPGTPATGTTIGALLVYESSDQGNRIDIGGITNVSFTGTSKIFTIQFRAQSGGDTQGIQDASIEFFRVS
jgi:hypothetical protein